MIAGASKGPFLCFSKMDALPTTSTICGCGQAEHKLQAQQHFGKKQQLAQRHGTFQCSYGAPGRRGSLLRAAPQLRLGAKHAKAHLLPREAKSASAGARCLACLVSALAASQPFLEHLCGAAALFSSLGGSSSRLQSLATRAAAVLLAPWLLEEH